MKLFTEDFFSKCDQICSSLQIWSHLLKKSFTENFNFCAVKLCSLISLISFTAQALVKVHGDIASMQILLMAVNMRDMISCGA